MCVFITTNVRNRDKKGAVLIVDIGSSAREFMCNAQVKRMSKKNNNHSVCRILRPFWGLIFNVFYGFFFIVWLINEQIFEREKKSKFQKVNDLFPAQHSWHKHKPAQKSIVTVTQFCYLYVVHMIQIILLIFVNIYFSLLKFNYASRNAKSQVKARATHTNKKWKSIQILTSFDFISRFLS